MVTGMATSKVTITVDDDQLKEIRDLVSEGKSPNISAFVKHAIDVALHDAAGWKDILEGALLETGGPLSEKERAWADGVLTPKKRKRNSKRRQVA
jgi:hypothetical protein